MRKKLLIIFAICTVHIFNTGMLAQDSNQQPHFLIILGDEKQPFCLVIASIHANAPWEAGDTSHWDLEDLILPEHLANTEETKRLYREYLAEIRFFDEQVAKAQNTLDKLGLENNTALLVLDKNGAGRNRSGPFNPQLLTAETNTLSREWNLFPWIN